MWILLTCARRGCVQRVHADSIVAPYRVPWKDREAIGVPTAAAAFVMFKGGCGGFYVTETVEEVENLLDVARSSAHAGGANVDPARNSTRSATSDLHFRTPAGAPVRTAAPSPTSHGTARLTYGAPVVEEA